MRRLFRQEGKGRRLINIKEYWILFFHLSFWQPQSRSFVWEISWRMEEQSTGWWRYSWKGLKDGFVHIVSWSKARRWQIESRNLYEVVQQSTNGLVQERWELHGFYSQCICLPFLILECSAFQKILAERHQRERLDESSEAKKPEEPVNDEDEGDVEEIWPVVHSSSQQNSTSSATEVEEVLRCWGSRKQWGRIRWSKWSWTIKGWGYPCASWVAKGATFSHSTQSTREFFSLEEFI